VALPAESTSPARLAISSKNSKLTISSEDKESPNWALFSCSWPFAEKGNLLAVNGLERRTKVVPGIYNAALDDRC
jgi:hypothetical protein